MGDVWKFLRGEAKVPSSDGGLAKAVGNVINKPPEVPVEKPVVSNKPSVITTGRDPDEGTPAWYRRMFDACEIDPGYENNVRGNLKLVEQGLPRYRVVVRRSGFLFEKPDHAEAFAWIIGFLHFKEATCDFSAILHNGQRGLIGPDAIKHNRKSTIVPKGVGPFLTWEDSAVDALKEARRWRQIKDAIKDVGELLGICERYNGAAYLSKTSPAGAENSPYLWARSNINDDFGKFPRDHYFDPKTPTNKTTGLAVLLKEAVRQGKIKFA